MTKNESSGAGATAARVAYVMREYAAPDLIEFVDEGTTVLSEFEARHVLRVTMKGGEYGELDTTITVHADTSTKYASNYGVMALETISVAVHNETLEALSAGMGLAVSEESTERLCRSVWTAFIATLLTYADAAELMEKAGEADD